MDAKCVREKIYKHEIVLSFCVAAVLVTIIRSVIPLSELMADKGTLVSVAVTLTGFLFTGQGIMLTLPKDNEFVQLLKEYGYLSDFHRLCRWSEILFLVSVFVGMDVFAKMLPSQDIANMLYLFSFFSPLVMAVWVLVLFGQIIKNLYQ